MLWTRKTAAMSRPIRQPDDPTEETTPRPPRLISLRCRSRAALAAIGNGTIKSSLVFRRTIRAESACQHFEKVRALSKRAHHFERSNCTSKPVRGWALRSRGADPRQSRHRRGNDRGALVAKGTLFCDEVDEIIASMWRAAAQSAEYERRRRSLAVVASAITF